MKAAYSGVEDVGRSIVCSGGPEANRQDLRFLYMQPLDNWACAGWHGVGSPLDTGKVLVASCMHVAISVLLC